jgi:hypothetical protein
MLKQMLYRHQGHISAALVLGGVDVHGPHLYSIYPHGSVDKLPYVTMGSGSLAAMGVFEDGYRSGMNKEDGCKLVRDAIAAGIFNDLGSGSNIDVCVITADGVECVSPPLVLSSLVSSIVYSLPLRVRIDLPSFSPPSLHQLLDFLLLVLSLFVSCSPARLIFLLASPFAL